MRVTDITQLSRKSDGKAYWKCTLEGSEYHLLVWNPPQFSEGADISEDQLEVKGKQGSEYYGLKSSGSPGPKPAGRFAKNDDDIMLQVAFKGAIELERHHIIPEGKINTARVAQATSELFASLVLMRPKAP